jgi:hypothetical protein
VRTQTNTQKYKQQQHHHRSELRKLSYSQTLRQQSTETEQNKTNVFVHREKGVVGMIAHSRHVEHEQSCCSQNCLFSFESLKSFAQGPNSRDHTSPHAQQHTHTVFCAVLCFSRPFHGSRHYKNICHSRLQALLVELVYLKIDCSIRSRMLWQIWRAKAG